MITNNTNLYIYKGDTVLRNESGDLFESLEFTEDDVAKDITGLTCYLTVKENESDTYANAIITKTYTNTVDPETGILSIPFEATDTSSLDKGEYYYDIQYNLGSTVLTLFKGSFYILQDITNP